MAESIYDKINDYGSVKISLASPNDVRSWSFGEIRKPETINYRTYRPEKDGLFCERIFGPERDWECSCGKYKGTKYKGIICDRCGVKVTHSRVRRKRMGHINLAAPVVHIWFFKAMPSRLGSLLAMKTVDLEKIIYFQDYVVTDPGQSPLKQKQLLNEEEYQDAVSKYGNSFKAAMGAEAIRDLLGLLDLELISAELRADVSKTKSKQKIKDLTKRLKIVNAIRDSVNKPEWMILEVVPVIPPDLRPLVMLESGNFATSDLNDLYRRIINRNNRLKKLMDLNAPEVIIRNEKRMLQQAVDALLDNGRCRRPVLGSNNRPLKSLTDMIKGKQGRFRENLLGKRVDYSARSVIVVGPHLRLHQCGLPKKIALELYQPFIIRELKERGLADTIKSAKRMLEKRDEHVWDILEAVIHQHPVMLNRAPTLHRMGIQAFEPVLVEGNAIMLHPLVCKGFNADFDGDQMAVHLPLSIEAQVEAHTLMLATNNIFSPANGSPMASPSQDIVLGNYYITAMRDDQRGEGMIFASTSEAITAYELGKVGVHAKVKVQVPTGKKVYSEDGKVNEQRVMETTPGRCLFNEILDPRVPFYNVLMSQKMLKTVINDCYAMTSGSVSLDLLDNLKEIGFKYATLAGLSVGITDLKVPYEKKGIIKRSQKAIDRVTQNYNNGVLTEGERYNQVIDIWTHARVAVTNAMMKGLKDDLRDLIVEHLEGYIAKCSDKIDSKDTTWYSKPDDVPKDKGFEEPGIYFFRFRNEKFRDKKKNAYVGYAGERQGTGERQEKGMRGRLKDSIYAPSHTDNSLRKAINSKMGVNDSRTLEYITNKLEFSYVPMPDELKEKKKEKDLKDDLKIVKNKLIRKYSQDGAKAKGGKFIFNTSSLNPIYLMSDSGARGSVDQIQQLAGMRALMAKPSGEIIETPIESNFREGLNVLEYFSSTHGARKGLADTALKTADSGYLTRKLADVAQNVIVNEIDCGTLQGITKSAVYKGEQVDIPLTELIVGRTARDNIRNPMTDEMIIRENEVITPAAAEKIEAMGLESIRIRSPLTCDSRLGVCAKCYGWDLSIGKSVEEGMAVGIIAAQSIGEPGTQLTMRTFHTGGVASRTILESAQMAPRAGIIEYRDLNIVPDPNAFEDSEGKKFRGDILSQKEDPKKKRPVRSEGVALKRSGEIAIVDEKGRELEKFKVPYGSAMQVKNGATVKKGQRLFSWDPHMVPILAEVDGIIRFVDVVEGETMRIESERKGQKGRPVVIEHKGDKHPQVIIEDDNGKTLDVHYLPAKARIEVDEGQTVQAGQQLARQPRGQGGTQDITGGLPRVTEIFEARKPKDPAAMAEISGKVELKSDKRRGKMTIIVRSEKMEKEHHVPRDRHLNVHTGDMVEAGDPLTDGPLVPHDILRIKGEEALQKYLLAEVQNVYRSQNVTINEKHVEVILSQMMQKVEIESIGDSNFLPGEIISKQQFKQANEALAKSLKISEPGDTGLIEGQVYTKSEEIQKANEKAEKLLGEPAKGRKPRPATAKTLLLGITKASLQSESFISAASFQETTKVLTEAALSGRIDKLIGLKENVILGHLVPAGTAFRPYMEMKVKHLAKAPLPKELAELKETHDAEAQADAAARAALGI